MTREDYASMQISMRQFDELEKQLKQVIDVLEYLNSPRFNRAYLTVENDDKDQNYFDIPIEALGDLKTLLKTHKERIATEMEAL